MARSQPDRMLIARYCKGGGIIKTFLSAIVLPALLGGAAVASGPWDEAKRIQNVRYHGIDFADLDPFFDGDLLTREDTRAAHWEQGLQSVGVLNGVALLVVWTPPDEQGEIPHLISARKAEAMNSRHGARATKSAKGKTDWAKLKGMKDADITFTEDAPRTAPDDWADAIAHRGLPMPERKEQIALRVDADVLGWFRAQGAGWQTRMNAVLKAYRDALTQPGPEGKTSIPRRTGG